MSNYRKLQNVKFHKETEKRENASAMLKKHLMAGEKIIETFMWQHKAEFKVLNTMGTIDNYVVYDDGRVVFENVKVNAVA